MNTLIVDSDATRQRQLRTILSSLGFKSSEIDIAGDPKTALDMGRKKHVDCIFLAIPPRLDIVPLLNDMRSMGGGARLGLVLYGSGLTKENVVAAARSGITTFLTYPFSVQDVEKVLDKALPR